MKVTGSLRTWLAATVTQAAAVSMAAAILLLAGPAAWQRPTLVLLVVGMAVSLLTAICICRHLLRHLDLVTAAISGLAAGRIDQVLAECGPRETRRMSAALNTVSLAIANHQEQLTAALEEAARQRDRFCAIINATSDGLLLYDANRRIIAANKRCAELLALEPAALRDEPTEVLQVDIAARCDQPEAYEERLASHFADESRAHTDHLVLLRPHRRVLRRSSCPAFSEGGRPGRVFTYTDVTAESDLDQMKSEFVSMASHELRTPLTSIHGALQLALTGSGHLIPPEDREMLDICAASTERLVRLVNDLLDLSKIEAGRMPAEMKRLDLRVLIEEITRSMQPMAVMRHITLVARTGEEVPPVCADRDQLSRVLVNLLNNAIKYSPEDSQVTVAAESNDQGVQVVVEDRGPGIPADQIGRLFKPFCRVGAQERQTTGGTGLGLAISRAIVQQHGGHIRAERATPRGSRFCFTLPAAADEAGDRAVA